jgi:hypothetical protein
VILPSNILQSFIRPSFYLLNVVAPLARFFKDRHLSCIYAATMLVRFIKSYT